LNHSRAAKLNAPSSPQRQIRFQGEADMNRQAKPVGWVENDPKLPMASFAVMHNSLYFVVGLAPA
jgi:hypothetical protein